MGAAAPAPDPGRSPAAPLAPTPKAPSLRELSPKVTEGVEPGEPNSVISLPPSPSPP